MAMKKPKVWLLEPNRYSYRVLFNFVDPAGKLLKSKTWQLHKEQAEPPRILLLQAHATLADRAIKPELKELGPNYVQVTTVVAEFEGELFPIVFEGFDQREKIKAQLAEFPLSLALVLENSGIHFTLHIATPR
jgi:hypothetical protein